MSSKGSHNSPAEDFKQYREIAPESLDDESLKRIIDTCCGDKEKISRALEQYWHDIPDKKAVGSEWQTSSKPKKGATISNDRGRGRSVPPGGRDGSGGRGNSSRSSSANVNSGRGSGRGAGGGGARNSGLSTAQKSEAWTETATFSSVPASVTAPVNTGSITAWGQGESLADKLKKKANQRETEIVTLSNDPLKQEPPAAESIVQLSTEAIETLLESGNTGDEFNGGKSSKKNGHRGRASQGAVSKAHELDVDDSAALKEVSVVSAEPPVDLPVIDELNSAIVDLSLQATAVAAVVEVTTDKPDESVDVVQQHSINSIHVSVPEHPAVSETAQETEASPKAFLKLGKWETPADSLNNGGTFQFGSFGSFGADDTSGASSTSWSVPDSEPHSALGNAHGVVEPSNVPWNTNPAVGDVTSPVVSAAPVMSSLFPSQSAKPLTPTIEGPAPSASVGGQTGRFDQPKTSAPPGLENHQHKGPTGQVNAHQGQSRQQPLGAQSRSGKHDSQQQAQSQQQQPHQQHHLQQQPFPQYPQPPGIPHSTGRGAVAGGPSMTPFYGFETPYLHHSYAPVAPTATSGPPASVTGSTTASSSSAVGAQQQQPQQQQQQQQQPPYAQPPPGIAANPYYYPNAFYPNPSFYYGQPQVSSYPYQGRNVYQQPPRPYGSDPYATGGSIYSPELYQPTGQYGDTASSYGAIPMHPSMQIQGGNSSMTPSTGSSGSTGAAGKQTKGGTGSASGVVQQQSASHIAPDHVAHGNYYANPYTRGEQWSYQNPSQGWGIPFPGNSPTTTGVQAAPGFTPPGGMPQPQQQQAQQQQQQPQQQSGRDGQRSTTGPGYGGAGGSFGNRGSTSGASSTANWGGYQS